MKTQTKKLFIAMDKESLKNLTEIVGETVAPIRKTDKTFTAADFWRLQKQRRQFATRRYIY